MWKSLTARSEHELCAELNRLGVTAAQIICRGSTVTAIYFEDRKSKKSKNSKEGDQ